MADKNIHIPLYLISSAKTALDVALEILGLTLTESISLTDGNIGGINLLPVFRLEEA